MLSLQSQRHKADRELRLQTRSFMLRRQFKQRFLKNLTKVFHDDDYWDFEREYLGLPTGEGQRKEAWPGSSPGSKLEGHFLPNLPNGAGGMVRNGGKHHHSQNGMSPSRPSRGRKPQSQGISKARWSAADANGNSRGRKEFQNGEQREVSLPHIKISPPAQTSPQHSATSELHHFSPPKKIGFRFQKNASGVTRIFHAHDNAEEGETQNQMDIAATPDNEDKNNNENNNMMNGDKHSESIVRSDTETTNDKEVKVKTQPAKDTVEKPRSFKNFRRITNPFAERSKADDEEDTSAAQPVEEEIIREFPISTDQPTQDHRFKVLNKLLIKQEPPNDGYIELSPSFPREGPVNQLRHRIKELHLDTGNLAPGFGSRLGSARSFGDNVSQGVTPALSEVDHTDSEVDGKEHQDGSSNDALLRLGGV